MTLDPDLFATAAELDVRFEKLGGKIPVILADNVYKRPDAVREAALKLSYAPPPYPYPGSLAVPGGANPSLAALTEKVLAAVNSEYLPRVPIAQDGRRITAFRKVYTDFAKVDVHPDELSDLQRIPHTDPVPIFALIYLSKEDRGGTLFFEQRADVSEKTGGKGYVTESTDEFELVGRIPAAFNRLAIYPGFVPHSGEIVGAWIRGEERFRSPRLTQRLVFFA